MLTLVLDLFVIVMYKCMYVMYKFRYQLELKEEFFKRTEKLTENENRNKGEYLD